MNNHGDPMKWISDPHESAPADRQVSLAIGGVLGSFILFWGVLGYLSGDKVNQSTPVVRNDIGTVQLLPRGGSLDDPQPIDVPDLAPVNLPEGQKEAGQNAPAGSDQPGGSTDQASGEEPAKEEGFWSWVTDLFEDDKKPAQSSKAPGRQVASTSNAATTKIEYAPVEGGTQPLAPAPAQPAPVAPAPVAPAPTQPPAQVLPTAPPAPPAAPPAQPQKPGNDNTNNQSIQDPTLITEMFKKLRINTITEVPGFTPSQFGEGWSDIDGNNCSTRNDILARDLIDIEYGTGCNVAGGTLVDPYTGKTITYVNHIETADDVEISHVVSLHNAWLTGAHELSLPQRITLMNDPLNLVAVDGVANQAKGDKDASQWLPENKAFHCEYIARQIGVKSRYGLSVTPDEHAVLAQGLAACPTDMRVDGDAIVKDKAPVTPKQNQAPIVVEVISSEEAEIISAPVQEEAKDVDVMLTNIETP